MKFVYGRHDWADRQRGEENCYLLTNGLGGFSSSTMIGSSARNDHSFFMACTKAPNHRYSIIHRMEETLELDGEEIHLSSQKYADGRKDEEGHRFLDGFCFEDYPQWLYHADGVELVKEIAMEQGRNTIAVRYRMENRTGGDVTLKVTPHLQFCPKGKQPAQGQKFDVRDGGRGMTMPHVPGRKDEEPDRTGTGGRRRNADAQNKSETGANAVKMISSNGMTLFFATNGEARFFPEEFVSGLYYAFDARDGRAPLGSTYRNHCVTKKAAAGERTALEIVYSLEDACGDVPGIKDASEIFEEAVRYREALVRTGGLKQEAARTLVKSAGQFVAERESTGRKTLLAGFPFFEDWGRDTMIAVAGCCIATGQTETAKSIFRTFASYCRDGLMPNLFPEGKNEPLYNTVDASLLFIGAVYAYWEKTRDLSFVEEMWPTMRGIIDWYEKGTAYGIHMDRDGLIMAGRELDQVTWMDVRIGDILPTPRHGKPVEVNAYWYNALRVMEQFEGLLNRKEAFGGERTEGTAAETFQIRKPAEGISGAGEAAGQNPGAGSGYGMLAEKVKKAFREKFWNEENSCLRDFLPGDVPGGKESGNVAGEGSCRGLKTVFGGAGDQIRCNQIWAVSMPFCALTAAQQKKTVDTVFRKLYTPLGLRTLAKDDPEFHGTYGGPQSERDLAYHQGTVWVFPLGAYYLAYLKTEQYSRKALATVRRQLEPLESALREGCIGQLPEIYDGEFPSFSRGCFAQAWSVGEMLRVYEALEAHGAYTV